MDPNETSGNETRPGMTLVCNKPGTSSSSVPSLCHVAGRDQQCFNYATCNGLCSYGAFHTSYLEDTEMQEEICLEDLSDSLFTELEGQNCSFSDGGWDSIFTSLVDTVDNGSSPVSLSPFTCPTVSSTPEQGEDAENQSSSMANKVASRQPTNPEGHFAMEAASHGKSVVALIGNNGSSNNDTSVEILPAEMSISGSVVDCKTSPGCVRPASACHGHRFSPSEVTPSVDLKGVVKKKNSNKWTCEIRISKKLVQDSKLKAKGKQWLGTFDTAEQAGRALHVGRYLLSVKNDKKAQTGTIFDPNTERVLSKFKSSLKAKPLDDKLLQKVKELAKDYGKNCSL